MESLFFGIKFKYRYLFQLNTVTHFLDLDYIYSSDNVNEVLRAGGTFSTTDDDLTHYVISGLSNF
jgi:hypothetical protein